MSPPLDYTPQIVPPDATLLGRGVWQWDLSSGARIMAVGVQADPLKDSTEWWARQQETMPQQEFLREYGIDFGVYGGKPVYPEYQDRLHAAIAPLSYVPNRPLIRGWDVPGPVGVVWLQRVPIRSTGPGQSQSDGFARCHVLAEFLMDGSVEEAGRQALALTREQFPQAVEVIDFADPAAFDRRANDSQSAADILRRSCGIHLQPGPRTLTARFEPVRRWLLGRIRIPPPVSRSGSSSSIRTVPGSRKASRAGITSRPCPGRRPATTTSRRRTASRT